MARDSDPTATSKVVLSNSSAGGRYVHTTSGPVLIGAGQTSDELELTAGELADLPDGIAEGEAKDEGEAPSADIPDDLADPDSRDGIVKADKLREVATAEGVEGIKADDGKAEVLAKIVAHRQSTQN